MITLQDLKTANNKNGDNYFDSNTLRFFNSTISEIKGEKGKFAYFIETIHYNSRPTHKIRKFVWVGENKGRVEKKTYGTYKTMNGAIKGLNRI